MTQNNQFAQNGMKIYLSIGGGKNVWRFVRELGLGWCIAPDKVMNPHEIPYFIDNGAFQAWNHKREWDELKFLKTIAKLSEYDFVIAPDIVCGGNNSLNLSLGYIDLIEPPVYLAVQDGMTMASVRPFVDSFDGLFIGGSISWKYQTARMWADLAHLHGKKCHAGRVNTWDGLTHMHFCGMDSVDGSLASRKQTDRHIQKYLNGLESQQRLMGVTA